VSGVSAREDATERALKDVDLSPCATWLATTLELKTLKTGSRGENVDEDGCS